MNIMFSSKIVQPENIGFDSVEIHYAPEIIRIRIDYFHHYTLTLLPFCNIFHLVGFKFSFCFCGILGNGMIYKSLVIYLYPVFPNVNHFSRSHLIEI